MLYMLWFFSVSLCLILLTITGVLGSLLTYLAPSVLFNTLLMEETRFALQLTLETSLVSLGIALVLGVPTAYLLARRHFAGKLLIETLLDLPLVTPPSVAGVGLLFLVGHNSVLGDQLALLDIDVLFSPLGIIVAQSYVATSIIVRTSKAAFADNSIDYTHMAWTLGLTPVWSFILVELPMAGRGIAVAAVLGWARAIGEFGATLMVAGATRLHTETLPMAIYLNIASEDSDLAVACAVILLALAFILLFSTRLIGKLCIREVSYV
ncbi:ABC transporter permease [Psychromonas sp. PT13]|uniref:ABC transporter permease n=1 Tax=Psychromonas sp. PT13 TaxID=3439547 RepID=UPI003EB931CC